MMGSSSANGTNNKVFFIAMNLDQSRPLVEAANVQLNRCLELILLLAFAAILAGCGGNGNPFTSVPVTGKVTYEDGTLIPVPGMKLFFHSLEPPKGNMHPRPAQVGVADDGTFKDVTTYKPDDGLVLGKHSVTVIALENGKPSKKIPSDYAYPQKSPLVVEVTKSGQFLEIKVPKPKSTK